MEEYLEISNLELLFFTLTIPEFFNNNYVIKKINNITNII